MHKITYINSHKKKKRFAYEIFGFLYSLLILSILIYYLFKESFFSLMANDLFITDYNPALKPLYFILIFAGILLIMFNFGLIGIFKTRLSYLLYPVVFITGIMLSLSGFLYGQDLNIHIFNTYAISFSCFFIVLMLCFVFEKKDLSRYGSSFMRILDITCASFYILFSIWILSGLFENLYIRYSGFIQILLLVVSVVYIISNSMYIFLKYESRYNIK